MNFLSLPTALIIGFATITMSPTVNAKDSGRAPGTSVITQTNDVALILNDLERLASEVEQGQGDLARMTATQKNAFENHRRTAVASLQGHVTVDEMPRVQRYRAFNALQEINGLVNALEGEQMICRREQPTGSRMRRMDCRPASVRAQEREMSQDQWRRSSGIREGDL